MTVRLYSGRRLQGGGYDNQGLQLDQHHYFCLGALAVRELPLPPQPVPPLLYLAPSGTPSTIIVIIIWPPLAGRSSSPPAQPIAAPSPFCAFGRLLWRVRVSLHTASATQASRPHPQPAPNLTYILRGSSTTTISHLPLHIAGRPPEVQRRRARERKASHKLVLVREPLFVSNVRRPRHQRHTAKGNPRRRQFLGLRSTRDARKGAAAANEGKVPRLQMIDSKLPIYLRKSV